MCFVHILNAAVFKHERNVDVHAESTIKTVATSVGIARQYFKLALLFPNINSLNSNFYVKLEITSLKN